jgi:hypothetical protein
LKEEIGVVLGEFLLPLILTAKIYPQEDPA